MISPYLVNTITLVAASTVITVVFSSLASYAFARHRFPGKNLFFFGLLGLMMIPSTLTLVPRYVLVKDLGMLDTPWALILPWAAQSMAFGVLLCRGFFASLPEELFEAGRIDGAGEWQLFRHVAVPLSYPILVTLAVVNSFEHYNDYIWPLLTISTKAHQVVSVGLTEFELVRHDRVRPEVRGLRHRVAAAGGAVPLRDALLHPRHDRRGAQGVSAGTGVWRKARGCAAT